ncbi:MAG: hypothetical protein E6J77_00870 [Deltaproteobacteria bacterium]|nr:MAG: hypothetical protein E6J77_00870 [Deltaproteobacteria bacterium]
MVETKGFVMSPPAPWARMIAGLRPGRLPDGSATTADTPPPPGRAMRRRRVASFTRPCLIPCGRWRSWLEERGATGL